MNVAKPAKNAAKAVVKQTKVVAHRSRQPKIGVRLSALFFGALTFVSQLSYDTGSPLAILIPYEYKAEVTAVSALATLLLGAIGEFIPSRLPNKPKPDDE